MTDDRYISFGDSLTVYLSEGGRIQTERYEKSTSETGMKQASGTTIPIITGETFPEHGSLASHRK
ncbi:MAG: hypothetical protein PHQ75_08475 [Thermoguttaceae bacterium]|nr:hypothetical protein [Thermoguttaceae bacterium]